MSLPAFLRASTEHASGALGEPIPSLTPEVDQACSTWWEQARSAWAMRPAEGTPTEDEALRATFALLLEMTRALVGHPQAALRALVNDGLRRVMLEQRETAETDRSFALRQLEQALEHYGVAVETIAMDADLDDFLAQAILTTDEVERVMPLELRPLYRAHGTLLMAFEAMSSGSADEFRYWARQAVERWRGVVAALPSLTALVRGAQAQVRARHAWDSWTEEDRAVEREAWKALR